MTTDDVKKFLYVDCETFDEGESLDEYTSRIVEYLKYCPWHYTEANAKERVGQYKEYIQSAYKDRLTVGDVALDIGYNCG